MCNFQNNVGRNAAVFNVCSKIAHAAAAGVWNNNTITGIKQRWSITDEAPGQVNNLKLHGLVIREAVR